MASTFIHFLEQVMNFEYALNFRVRPVKDIHTHGYIYINIFQIYLKENENRKGES